jgi:hypothetical protein
MAGIADNTASASVPAPASPIEPSTCAASIYVRSYLPWSSKKVREKRMVAQCPCRFDLGPRIDARGKMSVHAVAACPSFLNAASHSGRYICIGKESTRYAPGETHLSRFRRISMRVRMDCSCPISATFPKPTRIKNHAESRCTQFS